MRLALVFNPFKYKVHEENLRIVQKYFGLFPPLSLAWVAAIAEKAGHKAIIIDARTLGLSKEETLEILKEYKPDIIGFMMTTYMFPDTLEWIRFLKRHLQAPVVAGGYNLRVYPAESISHPEIDFGVVEHAYYTLPALLKELTQDSPNFDTVPGLAYKKDKKILITPHPQKIVFDEFPNPARHLLPNELYAEFPTERKNFTVMVTSLGCPFGCSFCEASKSPYNSRSPQTVAKEIEECYHQYGIKEIDIFDYEFTGIRKRVFEICRLLQEKKLDIHWACRSRVDTVDGELLQEMKRAGCSRIYFGLESGVQDILKGVNKRITLRQIRDTIETAYDLGIRTLGFFLIGAPDDTKETVKETVRFAKTLNLDYVQFSKCLAKPQTALWRELIENTKKDYWRDWVLAKEADREITRPWTALTNKEVNKLTKWAYISYYLRPLYILGHLSKVRSMTELKRKMLAFLDMVFSQEKFAKEDKNFRAFNENRKEWVEKGRRALRPHAERNNSPLNLLLRLISRFYIRKPDRTEFIQIKIPNFKIAKNYFLNEKNFRLNNRISHKLLSLNIEVSNYCNLDCMICPVNSKMQRKKGMMEPRLFKKIVDESQSIESVQFSQWGEPLLNKDIFEMLRYAKRSNLRTFLTTNATLLDDSKSSLLLSSGLDRLTISVDGLNGTYSKIRGVSFNEIKEKIIRFKKLRDSRNWPTKIDLSMVIFEDTEGEIDKFRNEWKEIADRVQFIPIFIREKKTDKCRELWRGVLNIYWDGRVSACCADYNGELIIGDARQERIDQIFNGPEMQRMRQEHINKRFPPLCSSCSEYSCYGVSKRFS